MKTKEKEIPQLSALVDMGSPAAVLGEIQAIILMMFPDFDFTRINTAFEDVVRLFEGTYPGYRGCNTEYHDLKHTTDATMAMIRLIHGASISGEVFCERHVSLGVIATLFHDTGYIQSVDDAVGTGAKYTANHIQRSIDFMERYFIRYGFTTADFDDCRNMLFCTGLSTRVDTLTFSTREIELLSKMLGTSDLIGQMADRTYLEKLLFLYHEFKEGNIPGMQSELDVLKNTIKFYEMTKKRFEGVLGGVSNYASAHFRERWAIDMDLYKETIKKNMEYLEFVLQNHEQEYREFLKRGDYVKKLS